ncbi:unnamed protein product [Rangifer tarandus platyrhynchus]|uniref:Uncharacterized protein n=2 Tax=Rangifer tarandus platyrhynchus TaxID=3082113 RepID=A0AC60A0Q6_RANTA|nr:unnamed protein product [Rangifer tarandus platyrhynchus]
MCVSVGCLTVSRCILECEKPVTLTRPDSCSGEQGTSVPCLPQVTEPTHQDSERSTPFMGGCRHPLWVRPPEQKREAFLYLCWVGCLLPLLTCLENGDMPPFNHSFI